MVVKNLIKSIFNSFFLFFLIKGNNTKTNDLAQYRSWYKMDFNHYDIILVKIIDQLTVIKM